MGYYLSDLITKDIDGHYNQLTEEFTFYSETLGCQIHIPQGFLTDFESVPLIRSYNKRGGTVHDYLCRIDAVPTVTKKMAARVYHEAMEAKDREYSNPSWFWKLRKRIWRYTKYTAVKYAWGYWKKHRIFDNINQLKGK